MKTIWNNKNLDFLKQNYIQHGSTFCSQHLHISIQTIRTKASQLKLRRKIKDWTAKEIKFLKTYYCSHGAKFCANYLQCSPARVRIKASVLGIIVYYPAAKSKVCRGCYKKKHLSAFSPHKLCKLGLQSKCKICRSKWESNRKQVDKNYRILHSIRNRIRIAIKKNCKTTSSKELLGCSINFLKNYISSKFQNGMSWDNYGKWHLDHIRPCSSFDMTIPTDQKQCFHYTNLQPLWTKDNLSKGSKQCN